MGLTAFSRLSLLVESKNSEKYEVDANSVQEVFEVILAVSLATA